MNYYITNKDPKILQSVAKIIEQNFENTLVGTSTDAKRTFDDLRQLRVDILIMDYDLSPFNGLKLIKHLHEVNITPRIIMSDKTASPTLISAAYNLGCAFFLHYPLDQAEINTVTTTIASQLKLINRMSIISELSSTINNPYTRKQTDHRKQIDHVIDVLRFLGIASENGYDDIIRIAHLMVDKNAGFNQLDLENILNISTKEKKVIYQRIRRTLKIAIANLATMCIDYPDNEMLLDYANNLFEYQNIHVEIHHQNRQDSDRGQISLQHFFDGLLQESYRVKSIADSDFI